MCFVVMSSVPIPYLTIFDLCSSPPPKIVFNRLNGKRYHGAATQKTASPAEGFTPAHEENVRFVYEGESHWISTGVDVGHSARSDLQGQS